MEKLTSTYNFVPLNEQIFYPSWANKILLDAPFSDGEDGYIDVTLHNVSPLFIRNGNAERNAHDPYSAHIKINNKRLYFLPATSLKGMLRSTIEIMSFGKMTQYTNRFFSKRELGGNRTADGKTYVELMKGVMPAWLHMKGEKLRLSPCTDDYQRISYADINDLYSGFAKEKTGFAKNEFIAKKAGNWYPYYNLNGNEYRIVCTGNINKKEKDYLFPTERHKDVEVKDRVKEAFFTVHEASPDFDKIKKRLKSGDELAVFYLPGKDPYDVKAIGISAMLRYPYKQSIQDLVKTQQTNLDVKRHDLAETIFGYINPDCCMRGRVQVGHAFAEAPLSDDQLPKEVIGVLGQPKPSFYPFYVKQTTNPYKTYDNAVGIAGRKLYRIHRASTVTPLPSGNNNKNALSHFTPIPTGQTFHLRITVHNLRKMETGALLSALTLHQTKGAWHNIGLARGFGYGKLEIDQITLSKGFSFSINEYLKEFEYQMSVFTHTCLPSKVMWTNTPQITSLMSILSEHEDDEMRVMEINSKKYGKEYSNAKQNFSTLEEKAIPIISLFTNNEKEKIKQQILQERKVQWATENKPDYDEAKKLFNEGNFSKAIDKYNTIVKELISLGLDTAEEKDEINRIQDCQKAEEAKREQEAKDKEKEDKERKMQEGLGAELDAIWPKDTPKAGQYKVIDFKSMNNRTEQWLKLAKRDSLTDREKENYSSTFHRLHQQSKHTKDDKKGLSNKTSSLWQNAQKFLSDRFEELIGDLYKK